MFLSVHFYRLQAIIRYVLFNVAELTMANVHSSNTELSDGDMDASASVDSIKAELDAVTQMIQPSIPASEAAVVIQRCVEGWNDSQCSPVDIQAYCTPWDSEHITSALVLMLETMVQAFQEAQQSCTPVLQDRPGLCTGCQTMESQRPAEGRTSSSDKSFNTEAVAVADSVPSPPPAPQPTVPIPNDSFVATTPTPAPISVPPVRLPSAQPPDSDPMVNATLPDARAQAPPVAEVVASPRSSRKGGSHLRSTSVPLPSTLASDQIQYLRSVLLQFLTTDSSSQQTLRPLMQAVLQLDDLQSTNQQYLRNVVHQFMETDCDVVRARLIQVIATLLQFTQAELDAVHAANWQWMVTQRVALLPLARTLAHRVTQRMR